MLIRPGPWQITLVTSGGYPTIPLWVRSTGLASSIDQGGVCDSFYCMHKSVPVREIGTRQDGRSLVLRPPVRYRN